MSILYDDGTTSFKEWYQELKLFHLSDEYRELLKESYELDLIGRVIKTENYVTKNRIDNPGSLGLFVEANKVNNVKAAQPGKIRQFLTRIKDAIINFFKRIGLFFKRLFTSWKNGKKVEEQEKQIKELNATIKKIEASADIRVKAANDSKDKAVSSLNDELRNKNNDIAKQQVEINSLKQKIEESIKRSTQNENRILELLNEKSDLGFELNKALDAGRYYRKTYYELYDTIKKYVPNIAETMLNAITFTQDEISIKSVPIQLFAELVDEFGDNYNTHSLIQTDNKELDRNTIESNNNDIEEFQKHVDHGIDLINKGNFDKPMKITVKELGFIETQINANVRHFSEQFDVWNKSMEYISKNDAYGKHDDPEMAALKQKNLSLMSNLYKSLMKWHTHFTRLAQEALADITKLKQKRDAGFKFLDRVIPALDNDLKYYFNSSYSNNWIVKDNMDKKLGINNDNVEESFFDTIYI